MYNKPIGIAVLTNSDRRLYLQRTLETFLENCSYRPLVIGIYDNGSTDSTQSYIQSLPSKNYEGVTWRFGRSESDLGCGPGVNRANALVREFEYTFFLESDWTHLIEKEIGVPKTWMQECLEFMETGKCDYLYFRRFKNNTEARFHDYHAVIHLACEQQDKFLRVDKFMYSNNPHLRRTEALFQNGTLPVPEFFDAQGNGLEKKINKNIWGKAEHTAPQPKNMYFYVWGMFAHESEVSPAEPKKVGCGKYGPYGCSTCKYGFLDFKHGWCPLCDASKDYHDLYPHQMRWEYYFTSMLHMRRQILPCVGDMEFAGTDL